MPRTTETAVAMAIPGYPSRGKGTQTEDQDEIPDDVDGAHNKHRRTSGCVTSPLARKRALEMMSR